MALFTILSVAAEIPSNEKAMDGISKFTKKGFNAINNLLRDEDDLPLITNEDFENLIEFTEMLASLLGHGAKIDDEENLKKMQIVNTIFNSLCFSENGYMQESLLTYMNSTVEDFSYLIASKIQEPYTVKKITRYVKASELEDEFYKYLCQVMLADDNISSAEQEYLDIIADSFEINRFDRKSIESSYKKT